MSVTKPLVSAFYEFMIHYGEPRTNRPGRESINPGNRLLNGGDEVSIEGNVAGGHSGSVKRKTGVAMTIEQNQAARAVRAFRKQMNGLSGSELRRSGIATRAPRRVHANCRLAQKIDCGFRHHDFHNGFAIAGAGDSTCFRVGTSAAVRAQAAFRLA